jgi:hypothetical protein
MSRVDMSDFDYGDDAGAGFENVEVTPRDRANVLLEPMNLDMQLIAVRSLLDRNREEDVSLRSRFNEIKARAANLFDDDYGEVFYESVYQDGTHSQAAIGMIAPLWESVLVRLCKDILIMGVRKTPEHSRWSLPDTEPKKWNCKYYWDEDAGTFRDNIISGVRQMAKMVKMDSLLGRDELLRVEALFTYRNQMFHNGIEWPRDRLTEFAKIKTDKKWPDAWFLDARRNDRPWIYYMTRTFIDECLSMLERFLDGVGVLFAEWNERTGLSFEFLRPKDEDEVT